MLQVCVISAILSEVLAIYCYQCSSMDDKRCGVNFKPYPKAVVNCDQEIFHMNATIVATMCRNIVQESN